MPIFKEYDSSNFATIEESIKHSKTNPFNVNKFSTDITFSDTGNSVPSPITNIKQLLDTINDLYIEHSLTEDELYRPESTSLKLYGSPDFWFVIMIINNIGSVLDYTKRTIKVIPENKLFKIEQLFSVVNNINVTTENVIFK